MSHEVLIDDGSIDKGQSDERQQVARRRHIDMLLIATVAVAFAFALQINVWRCAGFLTFPFQSCVLGEFGPAWIVPHVD